LSRVADDIRHGLEDALAFVEGQADASAFRVHVPETVDVKAIRAKLRMTRQDFAARFGFNINTLRHWERGMRQLKGPARAYLRVIERAPKAVQVALSSD
jgi:putative transcriptional regulator